MQSPVTHPKLTTSSFAAEASSFAAAAAIPVPMSVDSSGGNKPPHAGHAPVSMSAGAASNAANQAKPAATIAKKAPSDRKGQQSIKHWAVNSALAPASAPSKPFESYLSSGKPPAVATAPSSKSPSAASISPLAEDNLPDAAGPNELEIARRHMESHVSLVRQAAQKLGLYLPVTAPLALLFLFLAARSNAAKYLAQRPHLHQGDVKGITAVYMTKEQLASLRVRCRFLLVGLSRGFLLSEIQAQEELASQVQCRRPRCHKQRQSIAFSAEITRMSL